MQRFDPLAAGRRSPIAAFGAGEGRNPSPPCDGETETFEETGPSDGSRLLARLQGWAARPHGAKGTRFHYLLRCGLEPGQLPDRHRLRGQLDALPPPLSPALTLALRALLQGWPPRLRGLHRIELVPGRAWVSIAIGLSPVRGLRPEPQFLRLAAAAASDTATADAIVVGAGLAGCAMADALVRRGWRVTVIERRDRVGGVVAGIPLLSQHPALSPGEDRRSRLLIAALLASARLQDRLGDAFTWCGRFQPMPIAEARLRTAAIPSTIAQPIESSSLATHGIAGLQGIWYPHCATGDPQRWWRRLGQAPLLDLRLSRPVAGISRRRGCWEASDDDGVCIATAPVMILANQADAFTLAQMPVAASGRLRLSALQVAIGAAVSTIPGAGNGRPRPILGGSTYRIEEPGVRCVAGPIRPGDDNRLIDVLNDALNDGTRLPGATAAGTGYRWHLSAPAERLLLRDNLPMIGAAPDTDAIVAGRERFERNDRLPLPRRQGLHVLTGLGGRGLLWSVLGAEIIAAQVNDEPAIVEPDLQAAIDPARFLKRTLRRARSALRPSGTSC
jgi:tRNA 5-methylaminomethyl-2-thiouridine biosynthesis bifunctional protein